MKTTLAKKAHWARWCTLAAAALVLSGCATWGTYREAATVRDRAELRWAHLIDGQLDKAWALHSPAWRALNPYPVWSTRDMGAAVSWLQADVKGVRCEGDEQFRRCVVNISVAYRLQAGTIEAPTVARDVEELWLNTEGNWWLAPKT